MDINDVKISPRGIIKSKEKLIGKDIRSISNVRMNDEKLDKKKIAEFFNSISQKNHRDLTYKDLQNHLEDYSRYKIKMSWEDKQKFLRWAKSYAEKLSPKRNREALINRAPVDSGSESPNALGLNKSGGLTRHNDLGITGKGPGAIGVGGLNMSGPKTRGF